MPRVPTDGEGEGEGEGEAPLGGETRPPFPGAVTGGIGREGVLTGGVVMVGVVA